MRFAHAHTLSIPGAAQSHEHLAKTLRIRHLLERWALL
jgi:hypothetical protein